MILETFGQIIYIRMRRKDLLQIFIILVLIAAISNCKKKDETVSPYYRIEMDKNHRLSVVSFYGENELSLNKTFTYSSKEITIADRDFIANRVYHESRKTFFLNINGLADSSIREEMGMRYVTYYQYDNDNYLITSQECPKCPKKIYSYKNGNMTTALYADTEGIGDFYQYNSLINIIDIFRFEGSFVGHLNKNLILSYYNTAGPTAGSKVPIIYEYELNQEGLVTRRIEYRQDHPADKSTCNFEYVIK